MMCNILFHLMCIVSISCTSINHIYLTLLGQAFVFPSLKVVRFHSMILVYKHKDQVKVPAWQLQIRMLL